MKPFEALQMVLTQIATVNAAVAVVVVQLD
jgi:hypothetical protein